MKTRILSVVLLAAALLCAGCAQWPKDSLIVGAKTTTNTPWGPTTLEADVIATGKAAANLTLPELAEVAAKRGTKKTTP